MSLSEERFKKINDAVLSGDPSRIVQLKLSQTELNGEFLNLDKYKITLLQYSLSMKKLSIVNLLIEMGANVNVKDEFGNPLLHDLIGIASNERDLERKKTLHLLTEKLLTAGTDYNVKSRGGHTALTLATLYRDDAIVDILESHGARGRYL